jgi:8-oxo-dGTP diphosphatase
VPNVYLVRHADAGDRESWPGDDRDRPLNERGWAQARGLVILLRGEDIGRVLSSPYLRCIQTLEPLAEDRHLPVEVHPALAEGSDWREAWQLMLDAAVPTVMCSQGDVIADIVLHLVDLGLVKHGKARWSKGSTWILDVDSGGVRAARYVPPAV